MRNHVFLFRYLWGLTVLLSACLGLVISAGAEMDDFEVAEALLLQQKPKLAYPLAMSYALELDSYEGYRVFVVKFRDAPQHPVMLTNAFEKAKTIHTEPVYDDFIGVAGQSPYAFAAVAQAFELFRHVDTISEYERFIGKYPNTPEAASAMARIQQIAFERAQQADQVAVFDQYVRSFPYAPQIKDVLRLAQAAEQRDIEQELRQQAAAGSLVERRELLARRSYNEGRQAELRKEAFLVERKYTLLETLFNDTKAFTDLLDRAEELTYRRDMRQYQERIIQEVQVVKQAVDTQTRQVQQAFDLMQQEIQAVNVSVRQVQDQVAQVDQTIRQTQAETQQQLQQVNIAIRETQAETQQQLQQTQAATQEQIRQVNRSLNHLSGNIADALNMQVNAMQQAQEQALREASWEARRMQSANDELFRKAEEEARWRDAKDRRCAEELAQNRKYGTWSDCHY